MITLLPYEDFEQSAKCLHWQHLKQQVLHVRLLLDILHEIDTENTGDPAVRMWKGFEPLLCLYGIDMAEERERRKPTNYDDSEYIRWHLDNATAGDYEIAKPKWMLDKKQFGMVQASHRSYLLKKAPTHYGAFDWRVKDLPLYWPAA